METTRSLKKTAELDEALFDPRRGPALAKFCVSIRLLPAHRRQDVRNTRGRRHRCLVFKLLNANTPRT